MLKATLEYEAYNDYRNIARKVTKVIAIGQNKNQLAEAVNKLLEEKAYPQGSKIVIEDFKGNKLGEVKI